MKRLFEPYLIVDVMVLADPTADLQDDAHVLQLLEPGARAVRVPVRAQARLPRGELSAHNAAPVTR